MPFLRQRLVRYIELQPCTNAFIDARSPGSDQKENFTIIGPASPRTRTSMSTFPSPTASTSAEQGNRRAASIRSTAMTRPRCSMSIRAAGAS